MSKKYRFKIIYSEITEDNIELAAKLKELGWDDQICTSENGGTFYFVKVSGHTVNWNLSSLPKSFITEIKEPLTVLESLEEYKEDTNGIEAIPEEYYKDGWNACLENQKLGQVVDEEKDEIKMAEYFQGDFTLHDGDGEIHIDSARNLWKVALKYAREIK